MHEYMHEYLKKLQCYPKESLGKIIGQRWAEKIASEENLGKYRLLIVVVYVTLPIVYTVYYM